jgi:hypothetical protein
MNLSSLHRMKFPINVPKPTSIANGYVRRDTQYKYYVNRRWALKKKLTMQEKEKMIAALQHRCLKGVQLESSTYDAITMRKLVRHLKSSNGNQPRALESAVSLSAQAKGLKPQFPFLRM